MYFYPAEIYRCVYWVNVRRLYNNKFKEMEKKERNVVPFLLEHQTFRDFILFINQPFYFVAHQFAYTWR